MITLSVEPRFWMYCTRATHTFISRAQRGRSIEVQKPRPAKPNMDCGCANAPPRTPPTNVPSDFSKPRLKRLTARQRCARPRLAALNCGPIIAAWATPECGHRAGPPATPPPAKFTSDDFQIFHIYL